MYVFIVYYQIKGRKLRLNINTSAGLLMLETRLESLPLKMREDCRVAIRKLFDRAANHQTFDGVSSEFAVKEEARYFMFLLHGNIEYINSEFQNINSRFNSRFS